MRSRHLAVTIVVSFSCAVGAAAEDPPIWGEVVMRQPFDAAPSIAVGQPAHLQQELYACLDEVKKRKHWISHKRPEPWAALVTSDNTRNFYGRDPGRVEERYMAAVFGAFRAAVEEHPMLTVINDWNLNDADLAGPRPSGRGDAARGERGRAPAGYPCDGRRGTRPDQAGGDPASWRVQKMKSVMAGWPPAIRTSEAIWPRW